MCCVVFGALFAVVPFRPRLIRLQRDEFCRRVRDGLEHHTGALHAQVTVVNPTLGIILNGCVIVGKPKMAAEADEEVGRKTEADDTPKMRRRNSSNGGGSSSGKNGKTRKGASCKTRPLLMMAVCTMVFGPLGTLVTFMLLPDDHVWRMRQSSALASLESRPHAVKGHMRLLHLRLAGTDVNARFVIDERSNWEGFIAGCTVREHRRLPTSRHRTRHPQGAAPALVPPTMLEPVPSASPAQERLRIDGVTQVTDTGGEQ